MNPDITKKRGCFIKDNAETGKVTVVDYPTFTRKTYGEKIYMEMNRPGENETIPDGTPFEKEFGSRQEALAFCESENYVVCKNPPAEPKQIDTIFAPEGEYQYPEYDYSDDGVEKAN